MTAEPASIDVEGTDAALALYYDRLSRVVRWARFFGYGGGYAGLDMHRSLAAPGSATPPSPEMLDAQLIERLSPGRDLDVLDAGCGFGGTIFRWRSRLGGRYDGLTLSAVQAESASAHAARQGIGGDCRFMVRSYDLPPPRRYDLILAIESLSHSTDIDRTIKNLAGALKPSGRIAIVDDVPDGALADDDADFARFRRGWRCLRPPRASDYARAFHLANLEFELGDDLTAWLRPRSLARIGALAALNRLAYAFVPRTTARAMLDSYLGGLMLERLYRRGAMTYQLLVARRVQ